MTLEERKQTAEIARSSWPGRQLVNISTCNVDDSLELLSHSQQVKEHLKVRRTVLGISDPMSPAGLWHNAE